MARVTVEDCLTQVENRFALVHAAAKRTKMIFKGSNPLVDCKNKEIVTALREIADSKVKVIEFEEEKDEKKRKKKK
ncbi:MAG: DNA-directed RNA polymerase subunit omega [Deltaproteobacteria bacterium RIFCSPLOWO2_12_FULL_44_12]|nr:MAG: DNA-directed RNA polymerase subunit omega [Deltaproteobacteria bacterium RIFCSPHIGHO2_01_FULL_43_49]OGQ16189.1 MAG: DNA-directed RNA polymerase subunit omega [Deltaproteobacteria bacterium RIFCSPHIGHO2_02_FULL_44_53]OGQ29149.1 MAG: DNA-directed RNA polymerase subunit omega [Deltaproteobacteria bacterium RIFCSPHIGHO2_12_FULL_44_21]OGQ32706.1 MAG: DNA-directed RNA polymerase subunit omega [Deltaproteobacteria bacterium RIFCSPLOWO2_01_FULL_45_74]OGQ41808.1 MAG: DNA-directed RNA polymerase 